MSQGITDIQASQFNQIVLNPSKPVIVDFWAPWCGPCKAMAPAFASLAETYGDQMVFTKCNVDDHPAVAERYGIKSIPTLMIFQEGAAINAITGMVSQSRVSMIGIPDRPGRHWLDRMGSSAYNKIRPRFYRSGERQRQYRLAAQPNQQT